MKTLLLGEVQQDPNGHLLLPERLLTLENFLEHEGIEAGFCPVRTVDELQRLVGAWKPDLVFSAAYHVAHGQDTPVNVNGWLRAHRQAFVGSDEWALELTLEKPLLKWAFEEAGIQTPPFITVFKQLDGKIQGLESILEAARYPYIIKPANEGFSRGIDERSVVFDAETLKERLTWALETYPHLMVEEFLGLEPDFREFTAAMIGGSDLVLCAEIAHQRGRIMRVVTEKDKAEGSIAAIAIEDPRFRSRVEAFAGAMLETAGMHDYARADLVFARGEFHALEINGLPRLPDALFDACARYGGLSKGEYLSAIFWSAFRRFQGQTRAFNMGGECIEREVPGWVRNRLAHERPSSS